MNQREDGKSELLAMPLGHRISVTFAATLAFLATVDPNAALRYGPALALGAFLCSSPLRTRLGWTEWLLVGYVIWAVSSQRWALHPSHYGLAIMTILSCATLFVGMRAALSRGGLLIVVFAYAFGCFLSLARTSLQIFVSPDTLSDASARLTQVGELNVNYVAYSSVTAVLLFALLLHKEQVTGKKLKALIFIMMVALAFATLTSQTRGAQIALALLGAWFLVSRLRIPFRVLTVAGSLAAFCVSAGLVDDLLAVIDYGERSLSGLSGRLQLWDISRQAWHEHPILGIGAGGVREITPFNLPAHNMFLGVGSQLGVIGLILLVSFLISSQTDRLSAIDQRARAFRLSAILVTFLPIVLSSSWEMSASGWVSAAILSTPLPVRGSPSRAAYFSKLGRSV